MNYDNQNNYNEQVKRKNYEKLRKLEKELPAFCTLYFRGISSRVSTRTQIGYAYDLKVFFYFVRKHLFAEDKLENKDIDYNILDRITKLDIEEYIDYLNYYIGEDGNEHTNDTRGKARKLASVRSLYNYFYESELIKANPASIVHVGKIKEKEIVRLEVNEVADLLDKVEYGAIQESTHQRNYSDATRLRDLCIFILLLGTGIRVSECVGINLSDIDFETNGIRILRKGGKQQIIYFGDEVEEILKEYISQREKIIPLSGHEEALFLSIQKRRITVRAVEKLVKKYTTQVTTFKNITPHKLRSTYGTSLYQETGDIYLVASVLGHSDVNTTRKHYAAMDDTQRRKAANIVKLREKK